jgi:hypothetical protein
MAVKRFIGLALRAYVVKRLLPILKLPDTFSYRRYLHPSLDFANKATALKVMINRNDTLVGFILAHKY